MGEFFSPARRGAGSGNKVVFRLLLLFSSRKTHFAKSSAEVPPFCEIISVGNPELADSKRTFAKSWAWGGAFEQN